MDEPTSPETLKAIQELLPNFAACTGKTFDCFFCPVLHVDEPTTICMGHVIPEALGGTATVPQRKDVDSFYGSKVESDLIKFIRLRGMGLSELFQQKRGDRPLLELGDGTPVDYYFPPNLESIPPTHEAGYFEFPAGRRVIAIKGQSVESLIQLGLRAVNERDCLHAAVATVIKAAHLTCFKMFKYDYALSYTGIAVSAILKDFFLQHRNTEKRFIADPLRNHFHPHLTMVRPMFSRTNSPFSFNGTIADGQVMHLLTPQDKVYSIGVIVKMHENDYFSVFIPGEAACIDTYFDFLNYQPTQLRVGRGPLFPLGGDPSEWESVEMTPLD